MATDRLYSLTDGQVQHVSHHFFAIKNEVSLVNESPTLELPIGALVIDFSGDLDVRVPSGQQFVKQDLIDVSADSFAPQVGFKTAKETFWHALTTGRRGISLSLNQVTPDGWAQNFG